MSKSIKLIKEIVYHDESFDLTGVIQNWLDDNTDFLEKMNMYGNGEVDVMISDLELMLKDLSEILDVNTKNTILKHIQYAKDHNKYSVLYSIF